jgi:hypothetical protein
MMIMVTVAGWTFSVRLGKDEPEEANPSESPPAMNDAPLVIDEHNPLGFTIPVVRSGRPEPSDDRACR